MVLATSLSVSDETEIETSGRVLESVSGVEGSSSTIAADLTLRARLVRFAGR